MFGIAGSGRLGEFGKLSPNPAARSVACPLDGAAGSGFGDGALKRASAVIRLRDGFSKKIENTQDLVPRSLKLRHALADSRLAPLAARLQVTADQLFLAAEAIVKRGLGDPGVLDQAIDANEIDSILVKQLIGRGEQPLAGGKAGGRRLGVGPGVGISIHGLTLTDRSV